MKKIGIIMLCLTGFFSGESCFGQEWMGSQFALDTVVEMKGNYDGYNVNKLVCCICDGVFYFTEMQAFQHSQNGHVATIHALSLKDYAQSELTFSLPQSFPKKYEVENSFWVYDFRIYEDRAVISVQDYILLYRRNGGSMFQFDTMVHRPVSMAVFLKDNKLHYFTEDHDKGYRWNCLDLQTGKDKVLTELKYEAPHIVQANPNRYLFHDENNVYFLSTRYPVLHKYDQDGRRVEDITFSLPGWHPFEDEFIKRSLSYEYGAARIYATMDKVFSYSYPKLVFPIGGSYLMYYTQYDTATGKSAPMYALSEKGDSVKMYGCQDLQNEPYGADRFPFNLLAPLEDKARTSWGDLLVEVTAGISNPWNGLTPAEYKQEKERFFRKNEPVLQVRVMRLKNSAPAEQVFFYDEDDKPHSLNDLNVDKQVLLLHQSLECSACNSHILRIMNTLDTADVRIGIMYAKYYGALSERETRYSTAQYMDKHYNLYYLLPGFGEQYPQFFARNPRSYPLVCLYERGKTPLLFSVNEIFTDNEYTLEFSPAFMEAWRKFLSK